MDILIIAVLIIAAVILFLVGIIRNSRYQHCRFSGRRLHNFCQLLRFCLYGDNGRNYHSHNIGNCMHQFAYSIHAVQNTR